MEKNAVWLSPVEVASRTEMKKKTVYGWLQKGLLPYCKLGSGRGSRVRIKESDLVAFMDDRRRSAFAVKED